MTIVDALLILLAGVGAGAMNAVVGAGTLITFPTLLALGFPPVVANVSNTVGLVPGSAAAAYGFRATLKGRKRLVLQLVSASAVGGVLGGALLLVLPSETFEMVIPPLLLLSAVLAALQPRVSAWVVARRERIASEAATDASPDAAAADAPVSDLPAESVAAAEEPAAVAPVAIRTSPILYVIVFLTGIYGGYFGAAQGVILLAVLGIFVAGGMPQVNGIKNVLAGVANLVSAILFVAIAEVDWRVVGLVAVGATIGGLLGSRFGRRLPAGPLRALVVAVALFAAIWQYVR